MIATQSFGNQTGTLQQSFPAWMTEASSPQPVAALPIAGENRVASERDQLLVAHLPCAAWIGARVIYVARLAWLRRRSAR